MPGEEQGQRGSRSGVRVAETGTLIAEQVEPALTWRRRLKGLLGRRELPRGRALYLEPCAQVHTFFMKFPIDVVFVDERGVVVGLEPELRPWRMSAYYPAAAGALELPAGTIEASDLREGQTLSGLPGGRPSGGPRTHDGRDD